ncbi:MAG: RNA polymerase sigma factor RpoD [Candidatus Ozemobacter sibiricus]|uniref:RNA polymerase sigma factor RpoD n=1 Tax=Candidatus Ozemobacter sibiricus TaxID=2268124 RepID=A0A367ZTM1_9BACT|nr:MAG: RNA polymerase sigma factor RpoD [Candidatus Ozemobacter sibiricus]
MAASQRNQFHQNRLLKEYFRDLKRFPPLSKREEEVLLRQFKQGDPRARARLILSNLRFVVAVAKRYKFIKDVPFEDLIAVGNLGLMRAARRFNHAHKVRFISYAVWWIRQAIIQVISMHTHPIRLPLNRVHQGLKLKKLEEQLSKKLNRKPTLEELAREAGMKTQDLRKFLADNPVVLSLDSTPVDPDEELYLRDVITDPKGDPLVQAEQRSLREEVEKVMAALTDREKLVISFRFGLQSQRACTLEEIGKLLGLTRERVRQIEAQALEKLRHPSRAARLGIFRT